MIIHTLFSTLFALSFGVALGLFAAGTALKEHRLLRWGTWGFVICFCLLSIAYLSGFAAKTAVLQHAPEWIKQAIDKHHRVSKFVLTGLMLIMGACAFVLFKFRHQAYPTWFRANTLFIAITLLIFLIRSLITGFAIGWSYQSIETGISHERN